jgi:hypothetical protein
MSYGGVCEYVQFIDLLDLFIYTDDGDSRVGVVCQTMQYDFPESRKFYPKFPKFERCMGTGVSAD